MTRERLALGAWGEERAGEFLQARGWTILARNFRCPLGEVDIIARDGNQLIFVEVKTRRTTAFGLPQEAVGSRKQQQLIRVAQWYLKGYKDQRINPRFDVLAVLWQRDGTAQIDHFVNAFSLSG